MDEWQAEGSARFADCGRTVADRASRWLLKADAADSVFRKSINLFILFVQFVLPFGFLPSHSFVSIDHSTYLPNPLPTNPPSSHLTYFSTCSPTCLPPYLPTYLPHHTTPHHTIYPPYLPTHPPTHPPTHTRYYRSVYLSIHLSYCICLDLSSGFMFACLYLFSVCYHLI